MQSEGDLPAGITKVVEGVPYCPNCNIPMTPIASVDTTERPKSGVSAAMTLEQVAAKCVELAHEAKDLASELATAKEAHSDAKKAYEAKLVSLQLAVERMGRVQGGEQIDADLPLLDIAEQPVGRCPAVTSGDDDVAVQCAGEAGHGGPHGNGDLSWAVMDQALTETLAETVRIRLANLHIVVDVAEVIGWSVAQYDAVTRYVEMLESGKLVDDVDRPAFLSIDVPVHITALHASLNRVGCVTGLGVICAWTPEERDQAATWAADETESPDSAERPAHVPAPPAEVPRAPRRGGRKKGPAVAAVEDEATVEV